MSGGQTARIWQGYYCVIECFEDYGCYIVYDSMINFELILFINHNHPTPKTNPPPSSTRPNNTNPPTPTPFSTFSTPYKNPTNISRNDPISHAVPFPQRSQSLVFDPYPTLLNFPLPSATLSARSYFPSKIRALKSRSVPS